MLKKLIDTIIYGFGFVLGVIALIISIIPFLLVFPIIWFTNRIGILNATTARGMTETSSRLSMKILAFLINSTQEDIEKLYNTNYIK